MRFADVLRQQSSVTRLTSESRRDLFVRTALHQVRQKTYMDCSRRNKIDPDSVMSTFHRSVFSQANQGMLCCRVCWHLRLWSKCINRGNVDNRRIICLLLDHLLHFIFAAECCSREVDVNDSPPVIFVELEKRCTVWSNCRVVDCNI